METKYKAAISLAGHDRGRLYLAWDVGGGRVFAIDGKYRKQTNPKLKNAKHMKYLPDAVLVPYMARLNEPTDAEIRRVLAAIESRAEEVE